MNRPYFQKNNCFLQAFNQVLFLWMRLDEIIVDIRAAHPVPSECEQDGE